ncbi:MAG: hypothetical protein LBQ79_06200, partial [Deltaproteobacteria bacterium]|nr:hypothetical protein [Deltaproteobacteria bacterium]
MQDNCLYVDKTEYIYNILNVKKIQELCPVPPKEIRQDATSENHRFSVSG